MTTQNLYRNKQRKSNYTNRNSLYSDLYRSTYSSKQGRGANHHTGARRRN